MNLDHYLARMEVKFATDAAAAGTFSGYGAIFGNLDFNGDVILKWAFKETLKIWRQNKSLPPMLVQHGGFGGMDEIAVGKWTAMAEDDTGLAVEGKLINLDTERGRTIYGAMKENVLDGLSIGFRAVDFALGSKPDAPRRTLKKIDLVEVSIVQMPGNGLARIRDVKSAARIKTIREFEERLRDEFDFSHAQAKAIATHGFRAMEPRDEATATEAAKLIRRNIDILNPRR